MIGAPLKYDPRIHPLLARCAARAGYTLTEMAALPEFSVNEKTLRRWAHTHAEFAEALNEGRAFADGKVEDSLYRRATGFSYTETSRKSIPIERDKDGKPVIESRRPMHFVVERKRVRKHVPPDVTACIFWLKNRKPDAWRDRQSLEVSGAGGGPVQVEQIRGAVREVYADAKNYELAEQLAERLNLPATSRQELVTARDERAKSSSPVEPGKN